MTTTELGGKVIVVTGATGGVGAAISRLAAARGAHVVLADLDAERLDRLVLEIEGAGGLALAVPTNVGDEASVDALIGAAVEKFGRLDALVNNAATMSATPVHELELDEFSRVMQVNATGVFLGCRAAIRQFLQQDSPGAIVNMASISGEVGLEGQPAYCASKGAVKMLTKQIALDYSARGIRCNAVAPGSIDGAFLDGYLGALADPAAARAAIQAAHPLGRIAQPEEIAEPVLFLVSDRSSFLTGAVIPADGGYTAA